MMPTARNEAEELLLKLQSGEVETGTFMTKLLDTLLFVPTCKEANNASIQISDKTIPLILKNKEGKEFLILFTSPDRAKNFIKSHEGYDGGLLTNFQWILEKIGADRTISINPDSELGIDLESGMVQQMTGH